MGAIIGIVIAVCAIMSLAIVLVWLRRRRRRRRRQQDADELIIDIPEPTPFPYSATFTGTHSNATEHSDPRSTSKVRRQFLQNELRAAQEKMVDIHQVEQPVPPVESTPRGIMRFLSARSNMGSNSEATVARLRERNGILTARIRELEAQMESPWALGLSDEPPPGYSEEERR
ncbi:hypothetical protein FB451DRAFT_107288 [Mycena latifolia]|nr:hypothetical protein FB451DRAFT_107288 [Mycena latifolia]